MADFPALKAAGRRYSMGTFPVSIESYNGNSVRFRHGTTSFAYTLDLTFPALTEAEAALIRNHYRTQNGSYMPFALSTQVWGGHTSMTDLVPSTTLWKYIEPPQEGHNPRGLVDLSVRLRSVI